MPVAHWLANTQCALTLPPRSIRSPAKFQLAHWFRLKRKLRRYFDGVSLRHCSQLPIDRVSARRRKPTSLMSKPGDLNPTFELKRTFDPAIFENAIEPACPDSDVRVKSAST
jgi:hypothetical protein